jgi:peptide/nickel transport system ATP-binding protein
MSAPLLEIKDLHVSFHDKKSKITAVQGVDLTIPKGETVAVIGESGSGKSITSLSILGLLPLSASVDSGAILFKDKNLLKVSNKEMQYIRGSEISMVFQDAQASLNPAMKVGVLITEGLKARKKLTRHEQRSEALRLLRMVGLKNHVYDQFPSQLSGGMKQRVLIAMALSGEPSLLIADEPTTSLDVTVQSQILDLINNYKIENDASILLITHDFGVVAEYADRVYVMFGGKVVEAGDVYTLFRNPIHPYTKGLISSIPKISDTEERLKSVSDFVFEEVGYVGRRFAPETYSIENKVYDAPSELVEVEPDHYVRLFVEKEAVGR